MPGRKHLPGAISQTLPCTYREVCGPCQWSITANLVCHCKLKRTRSREGTDEYLYHGLCSFVHAYRRSTASSYSRLRSLRPLEPPFVITWFVYCTGEKGINHTHLPGRFSRVCAGSRVVVILVFAFAPSPVIKHKAMATYQTENRSKWRWREW
jgi:hypothetical protein